ncbi:MAG: DegT/DnrJ/EryC1/StrS family aminotransferase [Limnohabitans sp.]|nr:DegT/DnrJ/EryC1/StrS family aminotransferase [Limnohabitans sp.]
MFKKRIYLSQSYLSGKEEEFVLNSSNWIDVKGENVDGFESDLQDYLGKGVNVTALNSGTSALHLALILLGVQVGDEVICQSMTFSASANPIVYLGAIPVFVDSEPDTWNISPEFLEEAIISRISKGKKPKAIIAVHLYGMPYKHDEIKAISCKYDIPIIEDAAEALGSLYKNEKCGTLGDVSILSFNGNKIITSSGGGALIAKNKSFKERAVFLATQAREDAPHYQHKEIGYNYRMNNINAGIGRGQMCALEERIRIKRDLKIFYSEILEKYGIKVHSEFNSDFFSNHWLSTIVLNSFEERENLRNLFEKNNIESRPLWKPMHLQPVFSHCPFFGEDISKKLFEKGLCLPSSTNLDNEEKYRISAVFHQFFSILRTD